MLLVHPAVQALSLHGCRSVRIGVRCPALRALSLRNSVVTQLAVTAPALTALDLSGVQKLGDSSLRAVLTRLTGLQRLDLCQNMPLSDDTLREVRCNTRTRPSPPAARPLVPTRPRARAPAGQPAPGAAQLAVRGQLHRADAQHGARLPGAARGQLLELRLAAAVHGGAPGPAVAAVLCSSDRTRARVSPAPAQVPALESWTALEELTLDNCVLMMSVTLSLPRLRVLSLLGCRALAQVRLGGTGPASQVAVRGLACEAGACASPYSAGGRACVAACSGHAGGRRRGGRARQVDIRCGGLEALHLGRAAGGAAGQHRGAASLKRVVLASDALCAIRWQGFAALEALALACAWLAEVELSDCDALGDGALLALCDSRAHRHGNLPYGGCPRLRCAPPVACARRSRAPPGHQGGRAGAARAERVRAQVAAPGQLPGAAQRGAALQQPAAAEHRGLQGPHLVARGLPRAA